MTTIELGTKLIRRGLWLFVFGLVIGYGPWAHYMHGAMEEVRPAFLKNVSLWWGCPWTLAAYVSQLGSLAMIIFGLAVLYRFGPSRREPRWPSVTQARLTSAPGSRRSCASARRRTSSPGPCRSAPDIPSRTVRAARSWWAAPSPTMSA